MAEPETGVPTDAGIDPEEFFDEGYSSGVETGSDAAREELYDQLESEGFDEDEIEDLLFSEDDTDVYRPRRRGGRSGGRRHRRAKRYDPAPRRRRSRKGRRSGARRYDPAPRNGYRRYGRKAKGMLAKLKPMVMPGAAGLTFYSAYTERARALFTAVPPLITKDSVYEAIMYDLKNFDANAAIDRLQANASGIATPIVVGMVAKWAKSYVDPKLRGPIDIVGDALIGVGVGTGFKKLLDPPISGQTQTNRIQSAPVRRPGGVTQGSTQFQIASTSAVPCPGCTPSTTETPTNGAAWRV